MHDVHVRQCKQSTHMCVAHVLRHSRHVWSRSTYLLLSYSIRYTLRCDIDLWPLTLKHLLCIVCNVVKLCTKCEPYRAIRSGVITISIFDHNEIAHTPRRSNATVFPLTKTFSGRTSIYGTHLNETFCGDWKHRNPFFRLGLRPRPR